MSGVYTFYLKEGFLKTVNSSEIRLEFWIENRFLKDKFI